MKQSRRAQVADLHAASMRLLRLARRGDGQAGLGPAQTSALNALLERGPMSVRALAAHEGVAHATMSRMLSGLENMGALTKTVDVRDRRRQLVKLTEKGKRLSEEAGDRRRQMIGAVVSMLRQESVDDLTAVLSKLADRLCGK